jgi:hypothetical protein
MKSKIIGLAMAAIILCAFGGMASATNWHPSSGANAASNGASIYTGAGATISGNYKASSTAVASSVGTSILAGGNSNTVASASNDKVGVGSEAKAVSCVRTDTDSNSGVDKVIIFGVGSSTSAATAYGNNAAATTDGGASGNLGATGSSSASADSSGAISTTTVDAAGI